MTTALLAVLCGLVGGAAQGLIGGGGSVLGAPMLVYVVGLADAHHAIGTAAVAATVAALVSLSSYVRTGYVKWRCGAAFTFAGLFGAASGSMLGKSFSGQRLLFLFGALMIAVAISMLRARTTAGDAGVRLNNASAARLAPALLAAGFAVGFLAGFFGIGGGFLAVPGLLLATDMPMLYAVGTSLLSVAVFGLTTAVSYAASGYVDWSVAGAFMAGGVAGGWASARFARSLDMKGPTLRRIFAAIVAGVGLFVALKSRAAFFG